MLIYLLLGTLGFIIMAYGVYRVYISSTKTDLNTKKSDQHYTFKI